MSVAALTVVGQWSTVTTGPAITTAPLLRRDDSKWNTCGYFDGDTKSPLELCDDCVCQSTDGIMVFCSGPSDNQICENTITHCYAATDNPGWQCDDSSCFGPSGEIWCTEGCYSECGLLTWTDIEVGHLYCESAETDRCISFSHPETTDETTSSSKTTSSDSSSSRTAAAAAATTSSSTRKNFATGGIAALVIGLIIFTVFFAVAFFQFYRKRREAAAANKEHTGKVIMKSGTSPADAANVSAMLQGKDDSGLPPEQKTPLQEGMQAAHTPAMVGAAASQGAPRNAQTPWTVSPVLQPLPPSMVTSAMASSIISPIPSPAVSPVPYAQNLASQPSTGHLSTLSSQPTLDANRSNMVAMPPFPPTPPPDQRPSPGPENNNRNLPASPSQPSNPLAGTGNLLVDDPPYTSLYNSYQKQLPRFSDPPFTRFSQGVASPYIGEQRPPTMAASWFEEPGSVISGMDAGQRVAAVGAVHSPSGDAAATAGLGHGSKEDRQTEMCELMGSVPGQPR